MFSCLFIYYNIFVYVEYHFLSYHILLVVADYDKALHVLSCWTSDSYYELKVE